MEEAQLKDTYSTSFLANYNLNMRMRQDQIENRKSNRLSRLSWMLHCDGCFRLPWLLTQTLGKVEVSGYSQLTTRPPCRADLAYVIGDSICFQKKSVALTYPAYIFLPPALCFFSTQESLQPNNNKKKKQNEQTHIKNTINHLSNKFKLYGKNSHYVRWKRPSSFGKFIASILGTYESQIQMFPFNSRQQTHHHNL